VQTFRFLQSGRIGKHSRQAINGTGSAGIALRKHLLLDRQSPAEKAYCLLAMVEFKTGPSEAAECIRHFGMLLRAMPVEPDRQLLPVHRFRPGEFAKMEIHLRQRGAQIRFHHWIGLKLLKTLRGIVQHLSKKRGVASQRHLGTNRHKHVCHELSHLCAPGRFDLREAPVCFRLLFGEHGPVAIRARIPNLYAGQIHHLSALSSGGVPLELTARTPSGTLPFSPFCHPPMKLKSVNEGSFGAPLHSAKTTYDAAPLGLQVPFLTFEGFAPASRWPVFGKPVCGDRCKRAQEGPPTPASGRSLRKCG
jgi:hypothetical protein